MQTSICAVAFAYANMAVGVSFMAKHPPLQYACKTTFASSLSIIWLGASSFSKQTHKWSDTVCVHFKNDGEERSEQMGPNSGF